MNEKWNIGAKIWFGFYILTQWIMCIEFATKPITAVNSAYQTATVIYAISGLIGSVLILWQAIGHKKVPMYILLGIAVVSVVVNLVQSAGSTALLGLLMSGINYLVAHNHVE